MLENWISEPKNDRNDFPDDTLGHSTIFGTNDDLDGKRNKVFIICDKSEFASCVRSELYKLKNHFSTLHVIDVGDLKKVTSEFAISPLSELSEEGRVVFISQDDYFLNSIFQTLRHNNNSISLNQINRNLAFYSQENNRRILKSDKLFNLAVLGYQRHYCYKSDLEYIHNAFINHVSLGQLHENVDRCEPIIRACHGSVFNLNAIQGVEDNSGSISPNGMHAIEACQISKYSGINSQLRIYNITLGSLEPSKRVNSLAAQMIWYFLEGVSISSKEDLVNKINLQEHTVQTTIDDLYLTFWKSKTSGRWWFEIPSSSDDHSKIYPCSLEDYQAACKNEITTYVMNQINIDH
ncbi:MAG: hypothetical protein KJP00_09895 [Bacteroidia bacterium]|nr:hypothetical protein [Bacteroidia bacterium]